MKRRTLLKTLLLAPLLKFLPKSKPKAKKPEFAIDNSETFYGSDYSDYVFTVSIWVYNPTTKTCRKLPATYRNGVYATTIPHELTLGRKVWISPSHWKNGPTPYDISDGEPF